MEPTLALPVASASQRIQEGTQMFAKSLGNVGNDAVVAGAELCTLVPCCSSCVFRSAAALRAVGGRMASCVSRAAGTRTRCVRYRRLPGYLSTAAGRSRGGP